MIVVYRRCIVITLIPDACRQQQPVISTVSIGVGVGVVLTLTHIIKSVVTGQALLKVTLEWKNTQGKIKHMKKYTRVCTHVHIKYALGSFLMQSDSASRKRPFSTGLFVDWILQVLIRHL